MDTSKIITGVVSARGYTTTAPIVKEDYGIYLKIEGIELPSTYEVDFSNDEKNGTSITMIGNADGVLIPKQFISTGKDIFAFLYHVGEDYGRTVYKFRIPNKYRPDRTNEEPTPEEQSTIDQAISALNTAVEQTAQDVIDADASAQSASQSAENAQGYANTASQKATAAGNSADQAAQIKTDIEGYVSTAQTAAQTATDKAVQASQSATNASTSATTATTKAGEASASATTASNKAGEASASATTASNKAGEASGYASTASQKASDASDSATAAQTAQGKAEDAQTAAETAQGKAEDAQEAAETAAASVSASAAQIATNTADIADLQTDVAQNEADILKAFPTDSASGAIASFSDGAEDIPLKSLVVDINPVQDLSQGDPSPTNICPISGWTGMEIQHDGVNIWGEEWEVGGINASTGNNDTTTDRIRATGFISVKPNTTYYCSIPSGAMFAFFYDADKAFISPRREISRNTFTTPDNARFMRFHTYSYGNTYNHDISINYPSTDHDYHPYTGRSITIQLGQTVYGGKLDVLSGVLTVDRAMVDLGTLNWWKNATNVADTYRYASPAIKNVAKLPTDGYMVANIVCTSFPTTHSNGVYTAHTGIAISPTGDVGIYDPRFDKPENTTAEFKEAMNGVMLCYELATPITIQLTPNQVNSLLGANNIWADSGDTTCVYRADTKLFIERLTAPDSADMIADANITSGKYFMVGNSLFKATANIANGAQIIIGTNAVRKSLSEALNEINA